MKARTQTSKNWGGKNQIKFLDNSFRAKGK